MLAIAGTVATVLLTRAGTETDRLEQETDRWTGIANETGCGMAGGVWNNPGGPGSCGEPGTIVHNASTGHGSYTTCHTSSDGSPSHTHTWMDNNSDGDNDPATDDTDGSCS